MKILKFKSNTSIKIKIQSLKCTYRKFSGLMCFIFYIWKSTYNQGVFGWKQKKSIIVLGRKKNELHGLAVDLAIKDNMVGWKWNEAT